jgi:coproporphyrinogen III oxidase
MTQTLDIAGLTPASSLQAAEAVALVQDLQLFFKAKLEAVSLPLGDSPFESIEWLRDDGRHGGGRRYAKALSPVFNRGSINVSCVHYDDMPERRLSSATALSTIIHPRHPQAPSMHMHISWTEMRDGSGYWRVMADLNPSIPNDADRQAFEAMLANASGDRYEEGRAQGERYFYIPALRRHRGVSHFYLEAFTTGDFEADSQFAKRFGESVIECYVSLLAAALEQKGAPGPAEQAEQLAYHTAYLFQVLTLDRGTTSGLLVHDQNDVGILASLPSYVDRSLLASWLPKMESPQDALLERIVSALPEEHPVAVTDELRAELARVVRDHYRAHPEALAMQASGDVVPPTVDNHR